MRFSMRRAASGMIGLLLLVEMAWPTSAFARFHPMRHPLPMRHGPARALHLSPRLTTAFRRLDVRSIELFRPARFSLSSFPYMTRELLHYGGYGSYGGYYPFGGLGLYGAGGGDGGEGETTTIIFQPRAEPPNRVDALGLPNRNGTLDWPLALRVLPQTWEQRRQIDMLVQLAASQTTRQGRVDSDLAQTVAHTVDRLRAALLAKQNIFATITFHDAEYFLDQIEKAVKARE